jgi:hypothetical protein
MTTQTLRSRAAGRESQLKTLVTTQGDAADRGQGGRFTATPRSTTPVGWNKGWSKYGKT